MSDTAVARLAGTVGLAHEFRLRSMALNQLNETSLYITGRQRSSCAPAPGEEDARPLPVPAQTPLTLRRRATSRPEIPPQAIEKAQFGLGLWPAEAPSVGRPFGRPSHDGLSTAPANAHAVRRRRRTALPGRTRDRAQDARLRRSGPPNRKLRRKRLKRLNSGSVLASRGAVRGASVRTPVSRRAIDRARQRPCRPSSPAHGAAGPNTGSSAGRPPVQRQ